MLQLSSYFKGHQGAVLSLLANPKDKSFISSGSEGLIVRWYVDRPNEGDVLVRLSGYVSALAYDLANNCIYATVNHKGVYVISAKSGVVQNTIDMPAISFGAIRLTNQYIVLTTNFGELILVERETNRVARRINTGLVSFSSFAVKNNSLWFSGINGLQQINLTKINENSGSIRLNHRIKSIMLLDKNVVILTAKGVQLWDLKRMKIAHELIGVDNADFTMACSSPKSLRILALTANHYLYQYIITKKGFQFIEKTQIAHNGQINALLWLENYKFVISAGSDKKIGVWQLN